MSFIADSLLKAPQDPNGRPYDFKRAVKVIEAGSAAALETAINAFLTTLRTTYEYVAVIDLAVVSPANKKTQAVISYGWFQPEIY